MARGQQQSASVTVAFRAEQPPLDRCWFCPRCSDLATVCVCVCVCWGWVAGGVGAAQQLPGPQGFTQTRAFTPVPSGLGGSS